MKKKTLIISGCVIVAALVAIICILGSSTQNPVKNTTWEWNGTILKFEDKSFDWQSAEAIRKGEYKAYTGKKASAAIDKYVEEYNNASDAPKEEKWGFEDEVNARKKEMSSNAFVIEEKLSSFTYEGEDVPYYSAMYICDKSADKLTLTDVRTGFVCEFNPADTDAKPASLKQDYSVIPSIDNNTTSDEHLPFTYSAPEGFKKITSEDSFVNYASDDSLITISKMKETPLYGVIDGYPVKEKASWNEDAYLATDSMGVIVSYIYGFEAGENTYFVESENKDALMEFAKSIKL